MAELTIRQCADCKEVIGELWVYKGKVRTRVLVNARLCNVVPDPKGHDMGYTEGGSFVRGRARAPGRLEPGEVYASIHTLHNCRRAQERAVKYWYGT